MSRLEKGKKKTVVPFSNSSVARNLIGATRGISPGTWYLWTVGMVPSLFPTSG